MPDNEVVTIIAAALTDCERDFSARAGSMQIAPGSFLTDKDRAERVVHYLAEHGYRVLEAD